MQENSLPLTPTRKQLQFLRSFFTLKYRFLLFGGAVGSGKSYLGALLLVGLAIDYPKSRWIVVRKNLTTLKRTTLQTFLKVLGLLKISYAFNRLDLILTFQNGSRIEFVEADHTKDPDFNKLKGLEVSGAFVDEINELIESAFSILITRIGRWNENGEPAFIFATCNPAQGWVKETWYDKWKEGTLEPPYYFLQALTTDNEMLSKEYLESLKFLPDAEYSRYVLGDWTYNDDPNQLIRYEWIAQNLSEPSNLATAIGIDVARMGNDRTVLSFRNGDDLSKIEIYRQQDTNTTAQVAIQRLNEYKIGAENCIVDVVGLGAGVVDSMRALGYQVKEFNSAESPNENYSSTFLFKNRRAEAFWGLREGLRSGKLRLLNDKDLIKELVNIRYIIKNKFIQIEAKEEIKRRLGYSCDIADAVSMVYSLKSFNSFTISTGSNILNETGQSYLTRFYENATTKKRSRFKLRPY